MPANRTRTTASADSGAASASGPGGRRRRAGRRAADALAPKRPHDTFTFDELARSYNFDRTSNNPITFTRLLLDECRRLGRPARVLDIGCGRGIGQHAAFQRAIRAEAAEYWGVEPDAAVEPEPGLFDHVLRADLAAAALPEAHFDLAYAFMVMEHVADPGEFMRAVARCMAPDGVFLFATPNARHYFTRGARLCRSLRIDELTLRLIKGRERVESYHYPVVYRMNDERTIGRLASDAGLSSPRIAYIEWRGPRRYLPGPLRLIYHAMRLKRRVIRNPRSLQNLFGRIERPKHG